MNEVEILNSVYDPGAEALRTTSGGTGSSASQTQGTAADGDTATGNPVLVAGEYNATPPTYTDGDATTLQTDVNGNTKVREQYAPVAEDNVNGVYGVLPKPVSAAGYSGIPFQAVLDDVDISVKGSAGNLLSIRATNINAAIRYLQIHNKATAPTSGDTALLSFPIPAGTSTAPAVVELGSEFFGANGLRLSTGVAIGISTAATTFTAATTTDHVVSGMYV